MIGEPLWEDEENIVGRLTCIGILAIEDPVRDEVSIYLLSSVAMLFLLLDTIFTATITSVIN